MDIGAVLCLLLIISFSSERQSTSNEQASDLANLVKILVKTTAKPGRLTVMACWNSDFIFRFYTSFHNINSAELGLDYQLVVTNTDFVNVPDSIEEQYEFIVIDWRCHGAENILINNENKLMNYHWFLLDMQFTAETENRFSDIFQNVSISLKSEIYYMQMVQDAPDNMMVQQIYRVDVSMPLIVESFGNIENGQFIDYRSTQITSRRRQNLLGLQLRASMVVTNNDTLNHLSDYREIQTDPITKVNYILTEFLMSYLNATAEYSIVPSWGYKDDNNEWSGMVGQLVRHEAELGASPLFMTVERVPIIQYIASPTETGSRFIFRSPKLSYTDNVFLLPFDDFVWYCLIVLVIVTAVFLIISVFVEWKYVATYLQAKTSASDLGPSIGDIFFVIFGAVCQQGSALTPRSAAGRMIMAVAFTILMFLYTSYSANIVALLQSPSTRIKTLKDLYESRLEIGVDDTVFNRYYFSHAEESIRKKIYMEKVLKKNGQDNFMSLEEGVQRIRKGLFAFHMERALGYKLMSETFFEDEKCGLVEIAYLQVTDPWYAIKKNSSFQELFKIGLMRMHEHGLSERENTRMYTRKPRCVGTQGNFITASLIDTKPALLILLWGHLAAFTALVVELIIRSIKKKKIHSKI
ncbi:ionotropic receptor 75a-like [Sitodiplosis mosellana]|uniref:ionotropic receptor 75a-like n=1 Tax=Sitodiplosis mosellana TaxID=263140 RepID=UPI00244428B4|nr:ionotropic receptor 75a-like [Sitodiplosis mosellana]